MRAGITLALGRDAVVCAEASNAKEAIRAAMRSQPDVCLVGRDIPGDGLAAVRGISRAAPNAVVVVIAHNSDVDDLLESVRAGAIGYLPDPLDAEGLHRVLEAIRSNQAVLPRSMILELMMELRGGGGEWLTPRESQVLGMLRRGHSTAAIAARLSIAPVTVRRHISELVRKLGVADRAALARSRPGSSAGSPAIDYQSARES